MSRAVTLPVLHSCGSQSLQDRPRSQQSRHSKAAAQLTTAHNARSGGEACSSLAME